MEKIAEYIDVIFYVSPLDKSDRRIMAEDKSGKLIGSGKWVERQDSSWVLRIYPQNTHPIETITEELRAAKAQCSGEDDKIIASHIDAAYEAAKTLLAVG